MCSSWLLDFQADECILCLKITSRVFSLLNVTAFQPDYKLLEGIVHAYTPNVLVSPGPAFGIFLWGQTDALGLLRWSFIQVITRPDPA